MKKERKEEIVQLLAESGREVEEDALNFFTKIYNVFGTLTSEKLSTEEMWDAQDFLSDLILNKFPSKEIVTKENKIASQVRWMERIPETKGKLTMEEKTLFAFAIFWGTCMITADPETKEIKSAAGDITSKKKVIELMEFEKKMEPTLFAFLDNLEDVDTSKEDEKKPNYGLTSENPIHMTSVNAAYAYLRKLRANDGRTIQMGGVSSLNGKNGFIDCYEITLIKEGIFRTKKETIHIYIDSYSSYDSEKAPEGFHLI